MFRMKISCIVEFIEFSFQLCNFCKANLKLRQRAYIQSELYIFQLFLKITWKGTFLTSRLTRVTTSSLFSSRSSLIVFCAETMSLFSSSYWTKALGLTYLGFVLCTRILQTAVGFSAQDHWELIIIQIAI